MNAAHNSCKIRVESLSAWYGSFHVLKDIDMAIYPRSITGLIGPSGCGKTTLLRSTAGLESITSGQIFYGGRDMTSIPPFRRNIGMVFQSFALYPHMNIFENVAYGLRVRKTPETEVRRKVTEVMELVGLTEELKRNPSPAGLSGGQQQRVAIARALANRPPVILADEPTAPLDSERALSVITILNAMAKQYETAIIVVTHDEKIIPTFRRIYRIRDGRTEETAGEDFGPARKTSFAGS